MMRHARIKPDLAVFCRMKSTILISTSLCHFSEAMTPPEVFSASQEYQNKSLIFQEKTLLTKNILNCEIHH